ncbi:hypothetical protein [Duganella vulcania]|uniref:Uncharacterized protein n=1 Tax=Duganella vulcania TaxID=2692166 RepID=A0A845GHA9_9BURK|nr:hypothetical protein [Duganella vulcania]MYM92812.1 hypothetical protein [Duganella vulcania]
MRLRKYLTLLNLCWALEVLLAAFFGSLSLYGLIVRHDASAALLFLGPPILFGMVLVRRHELRQQLCDVSTEIRSLLRDPER